MKKFIITILLGVCFYIGAKAQNYISKEIDGQVVKMMVSEDGDTIIVADLQDVSVTSKRKFRSSRERRHYLRLRYHANKVYPYAVEAVKVFREIEVATNDMKKRKRKKYIKKLQRDLKKKFKDPLKKLSKTQGIVLIKMIERELGKPCYGIVKELRGGFTATYWQTFAAFYGVDLKEGYNPKKDPVLEIIISGMDVSHEVAKR